MKKIILFVLLCFANRLYADDTAELQAMINAGNTTLPAHHAPYTITSLNLVNSLNANGNVINCTLTVGRGIVMNRPGVRFSNAEVVGKDDSENPNGSSGVYINADNDTVTHVYIHKFTAYGIIGGWGNVPVMTYNRITNIGYVGLFYISDKRSIKGGTVAFDTIDRSMLSAQTMTQGALFIRGDKEYASRGWKVHHNLLIMPFLPKNISPECFELRLAPNSQIHDNTCIGGSIGISVVVSDFVNTNHNKCSKQNLEGIEYADSNNGMVRDNTITDQAKLGVLIDGFAPRGCRYDTLLNNKITGKDMGIQLFKDTYDIYISNCTINADSKVINIQGAYGVTLQNCKLSGNTKGATALFLDNSTGKVTMHGGSITGCHREFFIYATTPMVTDDVLIDGVKSISVDADYDKSFSGGSSMGRNIKVK
jgi:parallel beta-helix repeat protein